MKTELAIVVSTIFFSYLFTLGSSEGARTEISEPVSEVVMTAGTVPSDSTDVLSEYTELDDLVILEKKKLVESDGAKLTYNVSEDPESGSSSIIELLRKVPGVSVDAEDNVKVNGRSNFKILMNGREDPMLKGDLKTILKSLPAASVKKIELISEPGAKYEAEGTAGILNIVTDRKQDLSGFMTQLQGWVNASQAGGSITARSKVNKVMLDARVNYNDGKVWSRTYSTERETEYLSDSQNRIERLERKHHNGWDYIGTTFNMSWEPDSLNLFTLSANYGYNTWGGPLTDRRLMLAKDGTKLWELFRSVDDGGRYNGVGSQISYQHNFGKEGRNLVASYEFDFAHLNFGTAYNTKMLEGDLTEPPYSASKTLRNENWHILQVDYANPFDSHHLLEAGAKMSLNRSCSDSQSLYGNDKSDAVADPSQTVNVTQFKNIYAAYASYTGTFGNWNVRGGLRFEHTDMGLRYRTNGFSDFTTRLEDLVPNVSMSYNFTPGSSLRAAYQMRISRPSLMYLNPYVNDLTPGWITYGNPNLKSEHSHNVSVSYSNYEGRFGGMAKLTYMYVANGINDVIFAKDNVIHSTYDNIGRDDMISLEINTNWNINNALRWGLYAGGYYERLKADSEMLRACNHGFFGNFNTDISYTLPCKVRLSAFGGLSSPWIDLQSRGSLSYYYGVGASRSFLKDDALTISVNANNFLNGKRTNSYTQVDETVRLHQISRYTPWNVGLSVTWKFGGLKAGVKKTSAVIEKEASSESQRGSK